MTRALASTTYLQTGCSWMSGSCLDASVTSSSVGSGACAPPTPQNQPMRRLKPDWVCGVLSTEDNTVQQTRQNPLVKRYGYYHTINWTPLQIYVTEISVNKYATLIWRRKFYVEICRECTKKTKPSIPQNTVDRALALVSVDICIQIDKYL